MRGWRNGSNLRLPTPSVNNEMCSAHTVSHLKSSSGRALMFRPHHTVLRISRNRMKKARGRRAGGRRTARDRDSDRALFPEPAVSARALTLRIERRARAVAGSSHRRRSQGSSPATFGRNARDPEGEALDLVPGAGDRHAPDRRQALGQGRVAAAAPAHLPVDDHGEIPGMSRARAFASFVASGNASWISRRRIGFLRCTQRVHMLISAAPICAIFRRRSI
jgi:hypothetical protein